jgi:septal ring factor EnvC (AmiA/AmiB activator)
MVKTRKNATQKRGNQKRGGGLFDLFYSKNANLSAKVAEAKTRVDELKAKTKAIEEEINKQSADKNAKAAELQAAEAALAEAEKALAESNKPAPPPAQVDPNAPKPSMFSGITSGVSSLWPFGKTTGGKSRRKQRRSRK